MTVGGESRQKRAELSALLSLAETLIAAGDLGSGIQLLSLAAHHPAADLDTRQKAAVDLQALDGRVSQTEFEQLVARGQGLTLAAIRQSQLRSDTP